MMNINDMTADELFAFEQAEDAAFTSSEDYQALVAAIDADNAARRANFPGTDAEYNAASEAGIARHEDLNWL